MAAGVEETNRMETADENTGNAAENVPTQSSSLHPGGSEQYRNAREYAQALRPWLRQYYNTVQYWTAMNNIMTLCPPCLQSGPQTTAPRTSAFGDPRRQQIQGAGDQRIFRNEAQFNGHASPVPRFRGQECIVPPFWKRVSAELIDFTILFYIKLVVTVMVMHEMGFMDSIFDYEILENLDEIDYDRAFTITSEVIAMEIINRLLITFFETLCLRRGIGMVGGATPGKRLLGLRVISCRDIQEVGHNRVLVAPASDIGWFSAFIRSAIKNFTIAFFFPACLTVFIFKHNRAAYDVLSSTIVVETDER
ncbi:hypothetical protein C0Q70_08078 [Pomacea canaliculata]|uniref:RDD domain-containing protein n=1 Tax=Pomacea canaliculata TaxID=400727 RepID=A0A2T7PGT6_POMCA|nr:protein FAM8A1-like [Pomacea canaliculata]PVD32634.1 hypothetical protein C0Q70_08078 [Pomacea canaliculata]